MLSNYPLLAIYNPALDHSPSCCFKLSYTEYVFSQIMLVYKYAFPIEILYPDKSWNFNKKAFNIKCKVFMPPGIAAALPSWIPFSECFLSWIYSSWNGGQPQLQASIYRQSTLSILTSCNVMTSLCLLEALPTSLVALHMGLMVLFRVYSITLNTMKKCKNLNSIQFSSVQSLSDVRLVTPWTAAPQASLSITNSQSLLKLMSFESVIVSNDHTLCCPLLLLPSIFPASGSFPRSQFFASGGQIIRVSASASAFISMNIQDWFPLGLTDLIPWDSQESSTTPQFKIIPSSVLSFLYSPTLTSIHDYWKNHSFD